MQHNTEQARKHITTTEPQAMSPNPPAKPADKTAARQKAVLQTRRDSMAKNRKPRGKVKQVTSRTSGVVDANQAYTLDRLCEITGLGYSAIRAAEQEGLQVAFVGNRKQIRGQAWLDYLTWKEKQSSAKKVSVRRAASPS